MQFSHVSQVRSHLYFNLSGCDHPVQTNTRKVSHQAGIGCLQIILALPVAMQTNQLLFLVLLITERQRKCHSLKDPFGVCMYLSVQIIGLDVHVYACLCVSLSEHINAWRTGWMLLKSTFR